jgi:hypothetical protein
MAVLCFATIVLSLSSATSPLALLSSAEGSSADSVAEVLLVQRSARGIVDGLIEQSQHGTRIGIIDRDVAERGRAIIRAKSNA